MKKSFYAKYSMKSNTSQNNDITFAREEASRLTSRVLACQTEIESVLSQGAVSAYPLTDSFIADYLPFVKSLIATYVNNYKKYDTNNLESIAIEAFLFSIKKYAPEKGPFINFAALVIKRKLLNEVSTQNARIKNEINLSSLATTDNDGNEMAYELTDDHTAFDNPLKWEIEAIKTESLQFGIDFFKLNMYSPKTQKTKLNCSEAIRYLVHSDELLQLMRRKSVLPLKELCEATSLDRKMMERHRQYIIVVTLIASDDYPYLQSWLALRKYGVLP